MPLTGVVDDPSTVNIKIHAAVNTGAIYKVYILEIKDDYLLDSSVYGVTSGTFNFDTYPGGLKFIELDFDSTNWNINQQVRIIPKRAGRINIKYMITANYTLEQKFGSFVVDVDDFPPDTFIRTPNSCIGARYDDEVTPQYIWQKIFSYNYQTFIPNITISDPLSRAVMSVLVYVRKPDASVDVFASNSTVFDQLGVYEFWACSEHQQIDKEYWNFVTYNNAANAIESGREINVQTDELSHGTSWKFARLKLIPAGKSTSKSGSNVVMFLNMFETIDGGGSTHYPIHVAGAHSFGSTPNSTSPRSIPNPGVGPHYGVPSFLWQAIQYVGFEVSYSALPTLPGPTITGGTFVITELDSPNDGSYALANTHMVQQIVLNGATFTPTAIFTRSEQILPPGSLIWNCKLRNDRDVPIGLPNPASTIDFDLDIIDTTTRNGAAYYYGCTFINSGSTSDELFQVLK